ncbi:condensation domain-containing protein, partial [Actinomadura barringtoniae]|uniref:condensation domain-containing protein n=1 Tax=Actinomadura barringtoniae TaxID=1427535 RepID=UPI0027DE73E0
MIVRNDALVAYLVPVQGGLDVVAVRGYLADRLPDYMVPSALVVLDELPVTINGKLDTNALPDPVAETSGDQAPADAREEILGHLFADVLELPTIAGPHDNFFTLGGHSLLAARLTARIRSAFGAELSVRALFENPTPAELAGRLDQDETGRARPALTAAERPERVPLSFGQWRLWFLDQLEGAAPTYNIPFVVRLTGLVDASALDLALIDVIARHETLRTLVTLDEDGPHQSIQPAPVRAVLELMDATDEELPALVGHLAQRPFDLSKDRPVRAALISTASDRHVLVVVVHHVAADGWSRVPLGRDVSLAYTARVAGQAPAWTELPVQYADFALWQRRLLGEDSDPESLVSAQLAFWRDALADLPSELGLVFDRPRPVAASHAGHAVEFSVSADVHEALVEVARREGVTVFMLLQAGLAVLLSRLGAGTDI